MKNRKIYYLFLLIGYGLVGCGEEDKDLTEKPQVEVSLKNYSSGDTVWNRVELELEVVNQGNKDIASVKLFIDDNLIESYATLPQGVSFNSKAYQDGLHEFVLQLSDKEGIQAESSFSLYVLNTLVEIDHQGPIPDYLFWITDVNDQYITKQILLEANTKIQRPDGFNDKVFNVHAFRSSNSDYLYAAPLLFSSFYVKSGFMLKSTILSAESVRSADIGFTDIPAHDDFYFLLLFEETLTINSRGYASISEDFNQSYVYLNREGRGHYKVLENLVPEQLNLFSLKALNDDMKEQTVVAPSNHNLSLYYLDLYQDKYPGYKRLGLYGASFDQSASMSSFNYHIPNELDKGMLMTTIHLFHPIEENKRYDLQKFGKDPLLNIKVPNLDLDINSSSIEDIVVTASGDYKTISGSYSFKASTQEFLNYSWYFQSTQTNFKMPQIPKELGEGFEKLNEKFIDTKVSRYSFEVWDYASDVFEFNGLNAYPFITVGEEVLINKVVLSVDR